MQANGRAFSRVSLCRSILFKHTVNIIRYILLWLCIIHVGSQHNLQRKYMPTHMYVHTLLQHPVQWGIDSTIIIIMLKDAYIYVALLSLSLPPSAHAGESGVMGMRKLASSAPMLRSVLFEDVVLALVFKPMHYLQRLRNCQNFGGAQC